MTTIETRQLVPAPIADLSKLPDTKALIDTEQARVSLDRNCYYTIQAESPSYAAVLNGQGSSSVDMRIRRNNCYWIQNPALRFTMLCSGSSVTVQPTPFWIDHIEVKSRGGSGPTIQRMTADELMYQFALYTDEQAKSYLHQAAIDYRNMSVGPANVMAAGETRDFYLPLYSLFTNFVKVNMATLMEEIMIQVHFTPSCLVSGGGSGTIAMTAMELVVESDFPKLANMVDRRGYDAVASSTITSNILDVVDIGFYGNNSFKPGNKTRLRLDQLAGRKLSHLLFCFRPANSTVGSAAAYGNKVYLGRDAQFEITRGSEPLLGMGSPIRWGTMQKYMADNFSTGFFGDVNRTGRNAVYMLSASDTPATTMSRAVINNVIQVDSTDYWLEVTPGSAAGAAAVHTVTLASAATGGNYCFAYAGQVSQPLAYNATVAQMKAAFEAIPAALAEGLKVTFSATAAAGTSFTATFDPFRPVDTIMVLPLGLVASSTALFPTTASTTAGVCGITEANYDLHVLAYCYNELVVREQRILDPRIL